VVRQARVSINLRETTGSVIDTLLSIGPAAALCLALLAADAARSSAGAQVSLPPFLEVRVPKPPTVATAENGSFLAYEVHVTNFMPQPVTMKKLDVLAATGDHRVLLSLGDSVLVKAVSRPGAAPMGGPERLKINGGGRAVVFVWVPLEARSAPTAVVHRLTMEMGGAIARKRSSSKASPCR
jgi:hypothetical protein